MATDLFRIMEAAAENKGDLKVLAVTALTSLDRGDLDDLGFKCDVRELVLSSAKRALQIGCDDIVSSGLEVEMIRNAWSVWSKLFEMEQIILSWAGRFVRLKIVRKWLRKFRDRSCLNFNSNRFHALLCCH